MFLPEMEQLKHNTMLDTMLIYSYWVDSNFMYTPRFLPRYIWPATCNNSLNIRIQRQFFMTFPKELQFQVAFHSFDSVRGPFIEVLQTFIISIIISLLPWFDIPHRGSLLWWSHASSYQWLRKYWVQPPPSRLSKVSLSRRFLKPWFPSWDILSAANPSLHDPHFLPIRREESFGVHTPFSTLLNSIEDHYRRRVGPEQYYLELCGAWLSEKNVKSRQPSE